MQKSIFLVIALTLFSTVGKADTYDLVPPDRPMALSAPDEEASVRTEADANLLDSALQAGKICGHRLFKVAQGALVESLPILPMPYVLIEWDEEVLRRKGPDVALGAAIWVTLSAVIFIPMDWVLHPERSGQLNFILKNSYAQTLAHYERTSDCDQKLKELATLYQQTYP